MAGRPAASAAATWRSTRCAKFTCAPGNQRAPGMRSSGSTALNGVGEVMPSKSQTLRQNASYSVTDHNRSAS